mmetsp:Transcript_3548/g.5351  ORF Transcript_3548/g.5351 Transcript_3548/m.5351 type:complete len:89 (-) Transcript_3548:1740-2006(-)
MLRANEDIETDPNLMGTEKYYEMTPKERYFMWFKKMNYIWNSPKRDFYFKENMQSDKFNAFYAHQGQLPGSLHYAMFVDSVKNFGSEE